MKEYMSLITRAYIKSHPEKIFLFGDNLLGYGSAGQAFHMRGEPNSIGMPTKKKPAMSEESYFTDSEFEKNKIVIDNALSKIPKDKTIVISSAGIGTGFAQLSTRAPLTFAYLQEKLEEL